MLQGPAAAHVDLSRYPAIGAWLARVASQPGHIRIDGSVMRRPGMALVAVGLAGLLSGCFLGGTYTDTLWNDPVPPEGLATISGHAWRFEAAGAVMKVSVANQQTGSYREHVLFVPGKKHTEDPMAYQYPVRLRIVTTGGPSAISLDPARVTMKTADGQDVPILCAFGPGTPEMGNWCTDGKNNFPTQQCGSAPASERLAIRRAPAESKSCFLLIFDRIWNPGDTYEVRLDGFESAGQSVSVPVMKFGVAR
jgi:hypothetical protein